MKLFPLSLWLLTHTKSQEDHSKRLYLEMCILLVKLKRKEKKRKEEKRKEKRRDTKCKYFMKTGLGEHPPGGMGWGLGGGASTTWVVFFPS